MNGVRTTNSTLPSPSCTAASVRTEPSRASASWQAYPSSAAAPLPPPSAWTRTERTSWPRSQAWTCRSPSVSPASRHRTELSDLTRSLRLPLFVKPVSAGSSFGITKVENAANLRAAVRDALQFDSEVIIEEAITGFEVGCAVMGNDEAHSGPRRRDRDTGRPLRLHGKVQPHHLKDTHARSRRRRDGAPHPGHRKTHLPRARLSWFRQSGHVPRASGRLVFNEVNTIPGFTSHSRFPNMMRGIGYDFPALLDELVSYGLEV